MFDWCDLAKICFCEGEYKKAVSSIRKILKLEPELSQVAEILAKLFTFLEPNDFEILQKGITNKKFRNALEEYVLKISSS